MGKPYDIEIPEEGTIRRRYDLETPMYETIGKAYDIEISEEEDHQATI